MAELRPCQFCGGKPTIIEKKKLMRRYSAKCERCPAYGKPSMTKRMCARNWNRQQYMGYGGYVSIDALCGLYAVEQEDKK